MKLKLELRNVLCWKGQVEEQEQDHVQSQRGESVAWHRPRDCAKPRDEGRVAGWQNPSSCLALTFPLLPSVATCQICFKIKRAGLSPPSIFHKRSCKGWGIASARLQRKASTRSEAVIITSKIRVSIHSTQGQDECILAVS